MDVSTIPELGGGPAYSRIVTRDMADTIVTTASEIETAVSNATNGEVIYIPGDAQITMNNNYGFSVGADNVTLASNRGQMDPPADEDEFTPSRGARLEVTNYATDHPNRLINAYNNGFRFSGIRLVGPDGSYITPYDSTLEAAGVWFYGQGGEVDNCQLTRWPFAPITSGGNSYPDAEVHVHHNHIHRNRLEGLGYGIDVYNGHALLEFNYMNFHRHSIAALGYPDNSWEARHNVVGPAHHGHIFDMHAESESTGATGDTAGEYINAHHNTFMATQELDGEGDEAVKIRGLPVEQSYANNNWFRHSSAPIPPGTESSAYHQERTSGSFVRFAQSNNHFGEDSPFEYHQGAQRFIECDHLVEHVLHGPPEPLGLDYDPEPQIQEKIIDPQSH